MRERHPHFLCAVLLVTVGCNRQDCEVQIARDLKTSASKFLAENPIPIDAHVHAVGCIDLCYAQAWDQMDGFTKMRADEPHINQAVLEVVEKQGRRCSAHCASAAKQDGCAALAMSYDNCNGQALGALRPCDTMSWLKARQCCSDNALSGPICEAANESLFGYTAILPHLPSMVLTALRHQASNTY